MTTDCVTDAQRPGGPSTSTSEENVNVVKEIFDQSSKKFTWHVA